MTSPRIKHVGLLLLILSTLVAIACRKQPPPPPPAAAVPAPAPTITLRAEPGTVERGQPITLQWEARNAASVQIEPGVGQVMATGNRQVNPTSSVTYTATATGPGGTATDTARVTVNGPPPPPTAAPPRAEPRVDISELFRRNVQDILFDYDKSDIRPDQVSRLQGNAAFLKDHPEVRFTIEGHADERGSQEYNLGLGDRRANAVKEFLTSQGGIQAGRINTVSYGEERQDCREQTEDCFQRNRRAHFTQN
jgi:peptidoglycan-associated lipoprotein